MAAFHDVQLTDAPLAGELYRHAYFQLIIFDS